jgi:large subunit ribosomal protein L3
MTEGILGRKLGMTQVFGEGQTKAVTAVEAGPCIVLQVKTEEKDGYRAAKLGFGEIGKKKGQAKTEKKGRGKSKQALKYKYMRELQLDDSQNVEPGQKIDVSLFNAGDLVDVTGISRGKGFAGVVKRHHFKGGPKTHGQSDRWRAPGSIGATSSPGRVLKGLHMAGHMGSQQVTMSNLEVVQSDPARNLLLIKGAVPGMTNGLLIIKKSRRVKR